MLHVIVAEYEWWIRSALVETVENFTCLRCAIRWPSRKDWLDKLGLPMPDTIDDLYETAKRFVRDDPDGNGENDTVGLLMNIFPGGGFGGIDFLRGAFGLANGWQDEGGKLVPMYTQTAE